MKKLLLIKAFRTDRYVSIAEEFVSKIFGEKFLQQADKQFECVYGGKIDNDFDRRLLDTFLKQLFCVSSFESNCKLVNDEKGPFLKINIDNLILYIIKTYKYYNFN